MAQRAHVEPESGNGAARVDITRPDGVHIVVEGDAAFVTKEMAAILTHLYPPPPPPPA